MKHAYLRIVAVSFLVIAGCASYYQRNLLFQQYFVQGDIDRAQRELEKNKKEAKGKNRLLYFLQNGVVLQLQGLLEESNENFEKAYIFTEDIRKNYAAEAFSLLSNPEVLPYKGEDFEVVLIHYYKAINFLLQDKFEEAQVECRRINLRLNELNDRYSKNKNRYRRDAFALNLMGIIFEATGDINSAFVSYRNAYDAYQEDYARFFGLDAPEQLKKDLLRSAYLNGFTEEFSMYQKQFNMKYTYRPRDDDGELVFFWNNGLGPVKGEWSINFAVIRGSGGIVTFANNEQGLSFPFELNNTRDTSASLGDLKIVRVAFPKYRERKPYYSRGELRVSDEVYPLELAENVNEIAIKTLEDRMVREFAVSLLRLAIKQAAEMTLRKKNEGLGSILSIANALTEKADTRNWQTLPYSISYARIPLSGDSTSVVLKCYSPVGNTTHSDSLRFGNNGGTQFFMFHTFDSMPLGQ